MILDQFYINSQLVMTHKTLTIWPLPISGLFLFPRKLLTFFNSEYSLVPEDFGIALLFYENNILAYVSQVSFVSIFKRPSLQEVGRPYHFLQSFFITLFSMTEFVTFCFNAIYLFLLLYCFYLSTPLESKCFKNKKLGNVDQLQAHNKHQINIC